MPRRARKLPWGTSLQRTFNALTRAGTRAVVKATRQAMKAAALGPTHRPRPATRPARPRAATRMGVAGSRCVQGIAATAQGVRGYRLHVPAAAVPAAGAPLLMLLHGCDQNAEAIAHSSRLQAAAARAGFLLLCPEQDRLANPQGCWNWFEGRSGRALAEAAMLMAALDQVCARHAVDPRRIAVAGLSAGASMAGLLGVHFPARFAAVAMHSGVAPGLASSAAGALRAMRGHAAPPAPPAAAALPPLLVIQGTGDRVVSPVNGGMAARWWAEAMGASAVASRVVQRGARHAMTLTEFKCRQRLAVRLCEVHGLGHAWSGGPAGQRYTDPQGPDAARLVMAFMAQAFGLQAPGPRASAGLA